MQFHFYLQNTQFRRQACAKSIMTAFRLLPLGESLTSLCLLISSIGVICYMLYGAIWRLYLSPIAHIPGPRFAVLTFWNEFYYDVVLGGKYTWKLLEYHAKYGMIDDETVSRQTTH